MNLQCQHCHKAFKVDETDYASGRAHQSRNECKDEIHAKEKEITELNSQLQAQKVTAENTLLEIKDRHKAILQAKDEEIERYKDLKSSLSTKMLGETLEQHCLTMFNMARSHG